MTLKAWNDNDSADGGRSRLRTAAAAAALLTAAAVAGCSNNNAPGADPGTGENDTQSGIGRSPSP